MMRVTWDGLEELKQDIRNLPETVRAEANSIVLTHARSAYNEIKAAYPAPAASLAQAMTIKTVPQAGGLVEVDVSNTHPLAHLYERGTVLRHTRLGLNRGAEPPHHVFWPRILRWERAMAEALKAMLRSQGAASVTGNAA